MEFPRLNSWTCFLYIFRIYRTKFAIVNNKNHKIEWTIFALKKVNIRQINTQHFMLKFFFQWLRKCIPNFFLCVGLLLWRGNNFLSIYFVEFCLYFFLQIQHRILGLLCTHEAKNIFESCFCIFVYIRILLSV